MGLQVAVQNAVRVAAAHAGDDLLQKAADGGQRQADAVGNIVARLELVHVRFEIVRHVLKDQIQAAGMGLNDIKELDLNKMEGVRGNLKRRVSELRADKYIYRKIGKGTAVTHLRACANERTNEGASERTTLG